MKKVKKGIIEMLVGLFRKAANAGKADAAKETPAAKDTVIAEVRRFAEEHELAACLLKSLLEILAELALGAVKGKAGRDVFVAILKALKEIADDSFPVQDDGLPHINGTVFRPDSSNIFDVAAEARR